MIHPLVPYGIQGAIWYQGESNAGRAHQYQTLFSAMIQDWRAAWGGRDFPFVLVQLANFTPRLEQPADSDWAELREAQTMATQLPNVGMAVIIDIGEAADIHPKNKQDVGARLAAWALANTYKRDVPSSGPMYAGNTVEQGKIRITFTHADSGLVKVGEKLTGFAIAGADKKFVWANAVVDGDTLLVSSPEVPSPVAVRYGWANNPACNLYSRAGLPASPFRTDDWPGITEGKLTP
jgi:sialate O-acetylesterase